MTVVEFLCARLEEDEQAARDLDGERWTAAIDVGDHVNTAVVTPVDPSKSQPSGRGGPPMIAGDPVVAFCGADYDLGDERAEHIARHDPARVMAEVAAKRAVIDMTFRYEAKIDGEWACCHSADEIRAGVCTAIPVNEIETLRILAAVYADHPDYQPEWRPNLPA